MDHTNGQTTDPVITHLNGRVIERLFRLQAAYNSAPMTRKEFPVKMGLRNNKDFWAGLVFAATGAAAITLSWHYPFGTSLRMGPGYFPRILGGILVLFGLYIMARGIRIHQDIQGNWSVRALILLPLSMILFGLLMDRTGFIPALAALVFASAASGREFRFMEVLLLTLLLGALSVAMFIWGLGLPYPLVKGF